MNSRCKRAVGAVSVGSQLNRPSRRRAETRFTDIVHWAEKEKGGNFGTFEQPEIFVDEVRTFFRSYR